MRHEMLASKIAVKFQWNQMNCSDLKW